MALMPDNQARGPREASRLGLPDGFKIYSPNPFGGMNQQSSRPWMGNQEFFWRENFIKTGDGYLRTMWDAGTPIYSAPAGQTIVSFFFFSCNADNDLVALFFSDGTAIQLDTLTLNQRTISATAGTFYNGGSLPACVQWGGQYLLIANNHTANAYWVWDGNVLYSTGGLSPNITILNAGDNYTAPPLVTFYGGSGTGATGVAEVANNSVTKVTITNPGTGYVVGDLVQIGFSGISDTTPILTPVMVAGAAVANVIINTPGTGYTAGTYNLGFSGGGGTGAAGTYTVALTGGGVVSATMTTTGHGYTSTPTVTFPSGGGSGAAGTAILLEGEVVSSVTITNPGSGLVGTPLITFVGGGGTGAAADCTVSGGAITAVTVSNGGSGYKFTPQIQLSSQSNAASAVVDIMPKGISGNIIETYQSRVWLGAPFAPGSVFNGGSFLVTAPESFIDFATSDGGLIFTSSDPFLRTNYVNMKQTSGYLYPMGDSSVSIITNVQTSAGTSTTSPTTTFNYQNVDPQIGCGWRDTVQPFGRSLVFANHDGVYALYGGAVTKVSDKLNRLFDGAAFPSSNDNQPIPDGLVPSAAVAFVHEYKIYLLLFSALDPFTLQQRKTLACWDGKDWFVASQTPDLTYIGTQEIATNITAWGTDGTGLFKLFDQPSDKLSKFFVSKLYGAEDIFIQKMAYGFYIQMSDMTPNAGITLAVQIENGDQPYMMPTQPALFTPTPKVLAYNARSGDIVGQVLGCTVASQSPDFVIVTCMLGYYDQAALA